MDEPRWVLNRGWHDEIPAFPHGKVTLRRLTPHEVKQGWGVFAFATEQEAWAAMARAMENDLAVLRDAVDAAEKMLAEARAKASAEPGA